MARSRVSTERSEVRLQLLATPRLCLSDGTAHVLERRDAALLALLALDGPTPRGRAAALVWSEADEERGRNNLRQRLFRLRREIGRDVIVADAVLRLADGVAHDAADVGGQLRRDVGACAGELLGTLDYGDCGELAEWVEAARERWRAARGAALAEIAEQLERERQIAAALGYAERLVVLEPLLEHAHRRVMRLHYLRGDRAAALAAAERCRSVLQRELGAAPALETVELVRLIERSGALPSEPSAPRGRALTLLRPPRLVGREPEWQALAAACDAPQATLVRGEPGIGKSRLLADFAAARPGAATFGARPGDGRLAYALLARMLAGLSERHGVPTLDWVRVECARLVPDFGAPPTGVLDPLRLRQAVMAAFDGWHDAGLALLVLDDLHFADAATLELLPALVDAGRGRLAWLFGVRAGQVPAALQGWLRSEDAAAPRLVELLPLAPAAIAELLASLAIEGLDAAAWAGPLARHTGGNPMFILETLRALLAQQGAPALAEAKLPAPGNIGQLILRRLDQLSPDALKLARVAALAGQDFGAELAATVLQRHPLDLAEAWRELEAAQVLRDDAFAHDLIQDATLQSVPEPIARLLHRDIAGFLAARDAPPERVAPHWQQAADWARAGAAYEAAAVRALRASRRVEEVEYRERATECYQRADLKAEAFRSRRDSIDALLNAADVERARVVADRLLADGRSDAERLDALLVHVNVLLMSVKVESAIENAQAAIALARRLGARWREYDAARLLAIGLAQAQRAQEAADLLGPYEALVERDGNLEQRYGYWSDLAYVLQGANRRRRCVQALEQAIGLAESLGDLAQARTCTANLAGAMSDLGRVEEALAHAERARRLRERLGDSRSALSGALDSQSGMLFAAVGQFREALAHFDAALECFRGPDHATWRAVVQNHRADTLLMLGQSGRAQKALGPPDDAVLPTTRARRLIVAARLERAAGRSGRPLLAEAVGLLGARGDPYMRLLAELDDSREQPATDAAARCRELRARAEQLERLGVALKVRVLRADHLLRAGQVGPARDEIDEVVAEMATSRPWDLYLPELWWTAHRVYDAARAEPAALGALRAALAWIQEAALPNVPDEFCDSFLHRNPINRAVLTTASRRLGL